MLDYILQNTVGSKGAAITGAPIHQLEIDREGKIILARSLSRLAPAFQIPFGLDLSALSRDPAVVQAFGVIRWFTIWSVSDGATRYWILSNDSGPMLLTSVSRC